MKTSAVQRVKQELASHKASRRCCRMAELCTLLHMEGTYKISGREGHALVTESKNALTARKIYTLLHKHFELDTSVVEVERNTPRKGKIYRLEIPQQPGFEQALNELGILDSRLSPEPAVPKRMTRNECCLPAVMRGSFLGGGYISEPFGQADFEISFSSNEAARAIESVFSRKDLPAKIRPRHSHWVLYMKKRRFISEFLAIAGAHRSHLEWESQSIMNSTKNQVNRLVNCDSANARRLAEASLKQRAAIGDLESRGLLDGADPELLKIAKARTRYPQASMAELGKLLEPPVGKSIVQNRMRRLLSLEDLE